MPNIFKKIKTVVKFLGSLFLKPKYKTVWIEDLPKNLKKRTIYIVGGREYPFQAIFLCPKSCGKTMTLNISEQHNKWERWQITEHKDGTLSLHPSIWMRNFDCGCHYWFKKGCIIWTKQQRWFK